MISLTIQPHPHGMFDFLRELIALMVDGEELVAEFTKEV